MAAGMPIKTISMTILSRLPGIGRLIFRMVRNKDKFCRANFILILLIHIETNHQFNNAIVSGLLIEFSANLVLNFISKVSQDNLKKAALSHINIIALAQFFFNIFIYSVLLNSFCHSELDSESLFFSFSQKISSTSEISNSSFFSGLFSRVPTRGTPTFF